MKQAQRLQPMARLAASQERDAARLMAEMTRQTEAQQSQLEMLIRYRNEYFQNYTEAGQAGITAVQLRDYQAFLNRLDAAINQQQQQLAESRRGCEQSRTFWQGRRSQQKMIDKVLEKRLAQSRKQADSRAQKENDDRAGAAFQQRPV